MTQDTASTAPAATPDDERAEDELGPPTSAAIAIGIMAGIALVAVALIIGWVRLGGAEATVKPSLAGMEDSVPERLSNGQPIAAAPAALTAAFDAPVVVAAVLKDVPDAFPQCGLEDWGYLWDEQPKLRSVTSTPDAVTALYVGTGWQNFGEMEAMPVDPRPLPDAEIGTDVEIVEEPLPPAEDLAPEDQLGPSSEIRVRCTGTLVGGDWQVQTSSVEFGPQVANAQGFGWTCCDAQGRSTASATLLAPEGTAWAVQERGAYWLAYPVDDDGSAHVVWSFREGGFGGGPAATHVVYVDEEGVILDETFLRP